jgi:hypothetical protein
MIATIYLDHMFSYPETVNELVRLLFDLGTLAEHAPSLIIIDRLTDWLGSSSDIEMGEETQTPVRQVCITTWYRDNHILKTRT